MNKVRQIFIFLPLIFLFHISRTYSTDFSDNQFLAPQTQLYNLSYIEYIQKKIISLTPSSISLLREIWNQAIGCDSSFPIENGRLKPKPEMVPQNQWENFISLIHRLSPEYVNEKRLQELTSLLKNSQPENDYEPSNVYYFNDQTYTAFIRAYEDIFGGINKDLKKGIAGILPSGIIIFNNSKFEQACRNEYKNLITSNSQISSETIKEWLKVAIIYGHEYGHLLYQNGADVQIAESIADEAFIKRLLMYSGILKLTDSKGNFLIAEKQDEFNTLIHKSTHDNKTSALNNTNLTLEESVNLYFSNKVPSILNHLSGRQTHTVNPIPSGGLAAKVTKLKIEDIVNQFNSLFKTIQSLEKQRYNPKTLDENTLRFFTVGISTLLEPETGLSFTDLVNLLLDEKYKTNEVTEIYKDLFSKFFNVCHIFIKPMQYNESIGVAYKYDEIKMKQFRSNISKLISSLALVTNHSQNPELKNLLTAFQKHHVYLNTRIDSITREKEFQKTTEKHPGLFENLKSHIPSTVGDYSPTMSYVSNGSQIQSFAFLPHTNYKINSFVYAGHLKIAKIADKNGEKFNILLIDCGSDKKFNKITKTGGFARVEASLADKMAPILSLKEINIKEVWFFSGCTLREQTLPFNFTNYLNTEQDASIGLLGKYTVKTSHKDASELSTNNQTRKTENSADKKSGKGNTKPASKHLRSEKVIILSTQNESISAKSLLTQKELTELKIKLSVLARNLLTRKQFRQVMQKFDSNLDSARVHSAEISGGRGTWMIKNNIPQIYLSSIEEKFSLFHELIEISLKQAGIKSPHSLSFIFETDLFRDSIIVKLKSYDDSVLSDIIKGTGTELNNIYQGFINNRILNKTEKELLNKKITNALLIAFMANSLIKAPDLRETAKITIKSLLKSISQTDIYFENLTKVLQNIDSEKKYLEFFTENRNWFSINEIIDHHPRQIAA